MEDMKDIGLLVLGILLILVITIFVANVAENRACEVKATMMEFEWNYGFFSGCMIKVSPDQWIPMNSYIIYGS